MNWFCCSSTSCAFIYILVIISKFLKYETCKDLSYRKEICHQNDCAHVYSSYLELLHDHHHQQQQIQKINILVHDLLPLWCVFMTSCCTQKTSEICFSFKVSCGDCISQSGSVNHSGKHRNTEENTEPRLSITDLLDGGGELQTQLDDLAFGWGEVIGTRQRSPSKKRETKIIESCQCWQTTGQRFKTDSKYEQGHGLFGLYLYTTSDLLLLHTDWPWTANGKQVKNSETKQHAMMNTLK